MFFSWLPDPQRSQLSMIITGHRLNEALEHAAWPPATISTVNDHYRDGVNSGRIPSRTVPQRSQLSMIITGSDDGQGKVREAIPATISTVNDHYRAHQKGETLCFGTARNDLNCQ